MNIFGRKKGGKVLLNVDVVMKCKCGICQVQVNSECSKPKIISANETKKKMTPEMISTFSKEEVDRTFSKPEKTSGQYCAIGATVCNDLDYNKICNCTSCQVFKENNLFSGKTHGYFCRDGKAN